MTAVVSWSGGKDSCLALWRSRSLHNVTGLLSVVDETGERVRSHGVSRRLIAAQGSAMRLASHIVSASWQTYEALYIGALRALHADGVRSMIFGDIDLLPHREWEEKVCAEAGLHARLPLWGEERLSMVHEFLDAGFRARVVCVDGTFLDASYVGCEFDASFIARLPAGVDACGENGEFHTFVYDGPLFHEPVQWQSSGVQPYTAPAEFGARTYYFDLLDVCTGAPMSAAATG